VLLGIALPAVTWQLAAPSAASVRALQVLATLFLAGGVLVLAGGVLGIGLHYDGNASFKLENVPSTSGLQLVQKVVTGATPVLAPVSIALLGLVGLAYYVSKDEVARLERYVAVR
jgi:hypothetical protein